MLLRIILSGGFVAETAITVDVPFDVDFFSYTRIFFDKAVPRGVFIDPSQIVEDKHYEQYENLKKIIKDENVGKHIGALYRSMCEFEGEPNCKLIAVKAFQEHLKKATGKNYKIRLVLSGNV